MSEKSKEYSFVSKKIAHATGLDINSAQVSDWTERFLTKHHVSVRHWLNNQRVSIVTDIFFTDVINRYCWNHDEIQHYLYAELAI